MPDVRQVVLVGHCGADQFMLDNLVRSALGHEVVVSSANNDRQLKACMGSRSLLLVNRQLDGQFAATGGIELIGEVVQHPDPPVTMLISNYADAQQRAVEAGAQEGFGKSDLRLTSTVERLRNAIGR